MIVKDIIHRACGDAELIFEDMSNLEVDIFKNIGKKVAISNFEKLMDEWHETPTLYAEPPMFQVPSAEELVSIGIKKTLVDSVNALPAPLVEKKQKKSKKH